MYNYREIISFAYGLGISENDAARIANAAARGRDDLLWMAVESALGLSHAAALELLEPFERSLW